MTVLIAGAGATALALSACGGGSGSGTAAGGSGDAANKVTSIKLVAAEYSKDNTAAFWKQFAEKYKAKTGVNLDVQVVSWDSIDQQSSTMIQNNNAPDVLNLNVYASYAKDRLLYSADEVLSPAVKSDVLDAFVKSGTYQDKMYGMPDLSSARALFYNKDLFTKAGIAAPPKTWDEFEADAKKVQALGDGNIGYAMPLGPEESQGEFSIWTFNNGGDWKADGKWVINSPRTSRP
jgi:multiple sugar transport system substrate-binding protein